MMMSNYRDYCLTFISVFEYLSEADKIYDHKKSIIKTYYRTRKIIIMNAN